MKRLRPSLAPVVAPLLALTLSACGASSPSATEDGTRDSFSTPERIPADAPNTAPSGPTDEPSSPTGATGSTGAAGPVLAPSDNGLVSGPASPELVASARQIQERLACMRGKPFKQDPAVEFQSLADFRKYVQGQLDKEFEGPKGARLVRVLHALDIVDPSVDVMSQMLEAAVGQAAAYYDPETDTFYVVQQMPALMLNSVMAHELQHALQDQHTDLLGDYLDQGFGNIDKDLAARFVVEGEATLLGHAWLVADMQARLPGGSESSICHLPGKTAGDPQTFWPIMREIVAGAAQQTRDDVLNPSMLEKVASAGMGSNDAMAKSMEQLRQLPVYFFYTLLLPYNQGGLTIYETFEKSGYGWKEIDALFESPPESTEQVLHPEKLLAKEGFKSVGVPTKAPISAEAAAAWTSDPPERLGELTIRILMVEEGLSEAEAVEAAAGWNGDQLRVWVKDDLLAFDWKIEWDSAKDRGEFMAKMPALLAKQRPGVEGVDAAAVANPIGSMTLRWKDPQGRDRFGALKWTPTAVRWTDGWDLAPTLADDAG